jgi:hypothetical protein
MLFFVWYDDTPKKLVVDKIHEAIAAYVTRFATNPSLVLVNAIDNIEMADVLVRVERTVQPNTFWVGHGDAVELPTAWAKEDLESVEADLPENVEVALPTA